MNALSFQRSVTTTLLALSITVLATLFPSRVTSQLIGIKSVPVTTGDQFLIYPSTNLALGGVSIAMNDLLLDPFSNPAKGARLGETLIVGSPTFYLISDRNGAGRTIPVTFLADRTAGSGAAPSRSNSSLLRTAGIGGVRTPGSGCATARPGTSISTDSSGGCSERAGSPSAEASLGPDWVPLMVSSTSTPSANGSNKMAIAWICASASSANGRADGPSRYSFFTTAST